MPYRLRKAPNRDLYWVVGEDGTKHSKEPLPRERAEAQLRALYANVPEARGGISEKVNTLLASVPQMGGVFISKPAFIKEHKNLLGVLKRGKKSELRAEAQDQAQELAKVQGVNREHRGAGGEMSMPDNPKEFKTPQTIEFYEDYIMKYHNLSDRGKHGHQQLLNIKTKKGKDYAYDRITGYLLGEVAPPPSPPPPPPPPPKPVAPLPKRPRGIQVDSVGRWYIPKYELKEERIGKGLCGGGPIPDRNTLQQLASQSYKAVPVNRIGQFELVRFTPTLKFYKDNGNTIIVAIRGSKTTADWTDANSRIAIGQLENSDRYKTDLNTLTQFQTQFPPSQYDYYGVGHSLGGAILDLFLKAGLIKNGVSYNPAVQPQDFQNTTLPNERIYSESDPLYAIMGRNLAKKPETRAPRKRSLWEKAASYIPYVGTAVKGYDLLQSHQLDQFQGGFLGIDAKDVFNPFVSNAQIKQKVKAYQDSKPKSPPTDWKKLAGVAGTLLSKLSGGAKAHSKFEKQLRKVGIEPSSYLKEAQRRAKDAGLPYKVLGFADDGEHKLSIPNADGRMIKFGRVGYGDHLIWSHLEKAQKVPMGTADAKRNTFQKSHSAIKGDWKKDPFSANNLALKVLW